MFKITQQTLEGVLNYLSKQPFIEVAGLINELQKAEKEEDVQPKSK